LIPRVRAALVQFLAPISNSTEDRSSSPLDKRKESSFQLHKLLRLPTQEKESKVKSKTQVSLGHKNYRDTLLNWKGSMKAFRGIILDKKDNEP
jgi:hypothetical protein